MKTIALYNLKGGVGKTASAVNLAWLAAGTGWRTLLWDLDPQGAASFYFRIRSKVRGGARAVVEAGFNLDEWIRESDFPGLDVLPSDMSYRKMDELIARAEDPMGCLAQLVEPLAGDYDLLILDCPPSLSVSMESMFEAADVVLMPTIPTTLSLRTLAQLMKYLKKRRWWRGTRPALLPFFNMVDRRKRLHNRVCEWVTEQELGFLTARVPNSTLVERMGERREPVGVWAARSEPARAYDELWTEVRMRLEQATAERPPLYSRRNREALDQAARSKPPSAS